MLTRVHHVVRVISCLLPVLHLAQAQNKTCPSSPSRPTASTCRNIPGDPDWPSPSDWSQLNETVQGRLIATVPQASVCHHGPYDAYDEEACRALKAGWDFAQTFELKPAEIINAAFQNQSCDPFTPAEKPCELGNYVSYSINVTGADDIRAGIDFSREKNVRLVIKNTGHDYMGKSTGKGGLALWTHNLKFISILDDYKSPSYNGPAAKVGAGVISGELYAAVAAKGYRAVGGTCASVGVAGGWASGGGHSLLTGLYGMGADNVLEWEVILADGRHILATPNNEYSDLYWAMSGGGGGVWGVVLSMTTKIFPDGEVGGARLFFNASNIDPDTYWKAIEEWYLFLPSYTDGLGGGNTVEYMINAVSFSGISFTVPNGGAAGVDTLLKPYLSTLDNLNISYTYASHSSPNYYDHFEADFGPLPYGPYPANTLFSNRLFPRSISENKETNAILVNTIRNMTLYENGVFWMGCESLRVNRTATSHPDNAVNPAWTDTLGICTVISYWDWSIPREDMLRRKHHLVDEIVPAFEEITPGAASYLNEVDSFYHGDWKKEFYGEGMYEKLEVVKAKYDSEGLFYAYTGVGSDKWREDGEGRICKV
ncbi:hypothetical protein QBC37DRAFT_64496 [Rhypophila decipiens]|uniref:FAD-binding PCMH-type domain-containing protein n=1 Tax=Rhypophila decipiens TaxID=261697 RepID=A0AAN7B2U2_9PEZI|nr:hypothetical protein QBC37DRAFT_64496 [Rhypophila decipiens]